MNIEEAHKIMYTGIANAKTFLQNGQREAALQALDWANDDEVIDALYDEDMREEYDYFDYELVHGLSYERDYELEHKEWERSYQEYLLKHPLTPIQEINQWLEQYCVSKIHKKYVKKQELGKVESFLFKLASKLEFWSRKYSNRQHNNCPLIK